jgi:VanZ family protein
VPRVYRIAFWTAAAFALVMALLPRPPQLPGSPSDKVQHILAFATLAGLGSAAYPSASLIRLLVGLSAFGAAIEVLQTIPSLNRDGNLVDWIVDTCAASGVLLAARWWQTNQGKGRP